MKTFSRQDLDRALKTMAELVELWLQGKPEQAPYETRAMALFFHWDMNSGPMGDIRPPKDADWRVEQLPTNGLVLKIPFQGGQIVYLPERMLMKIIDLDDTYRYSLLTRDRVVRIQEKKNWVI